MVGQRQLLYPNGIADIDRILGRAVAPADLVGIFRCGVLGVMNNKISAA